MTPPYRMDSLALSVYGQLRRPELTSTADTAVDRLGDGLPDGGGVVVLGDLASALLRGGGDVDQASTCTPVCCGGTGQAQHHGQGAGGGYCSVAS